MNTEIRKLHAEGVSIYHQTLAIAMRDKSDERVQEGLRKLAAIKARIQLLEAPRSSLDPLL